VGGNHTPTCQTWEASNRMRPNQMSMMIVVNHGKLIRKSSVYSQSWAETIWERSGMSGHTNISTLYLKVHSTHQPHSLYTRIFVPIYRGKQPLEPLFDRICCPFHTVIRGYFVPCPVDDTYIRFCCFYFRWACTDQVSHKIYTKKEDLHKGSK